MTFSISAALKKKLCDETGKSRDEIEDYIWSTKDQHCFLCGKHLNRSTDKIELDHHIPVNEGGKDELANLNLTDAACNRYKRNHSTIDVRPHLKFQRFWQSRSGNMNFKTALEFYEIVPSDCYVRIDESLSKVELETSLGTKSYPLFRERVNGKEQLFCFAELPVSCVENDDAIQPRAIKLAHLFSIATDISKNPLHEQPAVRLDGVTEKRRILMFDGQHKTVANMINGRETIVFKVYINIAESEAIELVNSIQSRIKKLPLTPFELAAKMSDEFLRKLETYEDQVGSINASETGFVSWLDPDDRSRARKGIESAVIDRVIGDPELAFTKIIERAGHRVEGPVSIKESAFQKNVLKTLLYTKPLPATLQGEKMKVARERESQNVLTLLNMIYERGFVAKADEDPDRERDRIGRLKYQAALQHMCKTFRQLASREVMPQDDEETFFEHDFAKGNWEKMAVYIDKYFGHPVWVADLTGTSKLRLVHDALQKNQASEAAFKGVSLTAAYCADLEELGAEWAQ